MAMNSFLEESTLIFSTLKYFIYLFFSSLDDTQDLQIPLQFVLMYLYFRFLHQLKFMVKILTNHKDFLFVFYFILDHILMVESLTISYKVVLNQSFYDIFLISCLLLLHNYLDNVHKLFSFIFNFVALKKQF
jgi:hypothetical protein